LTGWGIAYKFARMKTLRGKRALVTGAASGIGRAIALELARQGVDVFAVDIQAERLNQAVSEVQALGVRSVARVCDVSDPEQIRQTVAEALAQWGAVDLLVNNAGITFRGYTHTMTPGQWEAVLAVNLLAPIRFIEALLPSFRRLEESHILNVASIFGLVPIRRIAAYQTTKFALVGLGQSLRLEYGTYGLGVTTLCPGFVDSELMESAEKSGMLVSKPMLWSWWSVTPEYVARKAIGAIRKNRGLMVVPPLAHVFWIFVRIWPEFIEFMVRFKRRSTRRRHGPNIKD
jgi:NAD(P)-dependent dehydrogenase (short-subunit alcohol dehydrogenase family)